jgi:glycosyltransferase involved in cell wall biosynthesis
MLLDLVFYIFLVSTGIQVIYLSFYLIRVSAYKEPQHLSDTAVDEKGVSVVVPAHDQEENLKKLIPILFDQNHPNFEIIIVDDRSNDNTYDFLLGIQAKYPRLRIVKVDQTPEHINGKKYALTLGIKAAKNDQIVLTDADCLPKSDNWLWKMTQGFQDGVIFVLGYSAYFKEKGLLNLWIRFETLFSGIQYLASAMGRRPYMAVGRNLGYRKHFFLEKKGFNRFLKVTGGDDDLFVNEHANRKNTKVIIGPDALVYSYPKRKWSEYYRQKVRHLSVSKYYRKSDKIHLALFPIAKITFWITFVLLLINFHRPFQIIPAYFLLLILTIWLFHKASRKLGDLYQLGWVPLMELFQIVYFPVVGIKAFLAKRVRWS